MGENRIIALAGRKESGKTEIAKICQNYGYNIISFATPLKKLIASLLDVSIDEVNKLKKIKSEYILNEEKIKFLAIETNIEYDLLHDVLIDKIFRTTREMLQFIGTDIIRKHCQDWHVIKTMESLDENQKYCFDDMRFKNEMDMVVKLGGDSWFVIRPNINNISNHESEISLKWQDFDNIIVNNTSLSYLKFNWSMMFDIGYENCMKLKHDIVNKIKNSNEFKLDFLESDKNEEHFNMIDVIFLSKYQFMYDSNRIEYDNVVDVGEIENNCVVITYDTGVEDVIDNPFMIEDLKFNIN